MPQVTFIDFEGNSTEISAKTGDSLMDAAVVNDVPGVDADCGGACACATCHVYIDKDWVAVVGKAQEIEAEMLDVAEEVQENSRLSCQISVTEEMDGLVVRTPESQY